MSSAHHLLTTSTASWAAVPPPSVFAVVRHGAPPVRPPTKLEHVAEVSTISDRPDWVLIDPANASPDVVAEFAAWRTGWERAWKLEPTTAIAQLHRLGLDVAATGTLRGSDMLCALEWAAAGSGTIDAHSLTKTHTMVASLRKRLAQLPGRGFGFLDTTPGRRTSGLAATWSPLGGTEVLAADASMVVAMHRDLGLTISTAPSERAAASAERPGNTSGQEPSGQEPNGRDPNGREPNIFGLDAEFDAVLRANGLEASRSATSADGVIAGIEEVDITGDILTVRSPRVVERLPVSSAQPLLLIVPGATRWRVRRIPLSVVWARTLAGLEDSTRYASTLNESISLTHALAAAPLSDALERT